MPEHDVLSHHEVKQFGKVKHFAIFPHHATHFLKLIDEMCKYEMDPSNIVEDTEQTKFCPRTGRRICILTDGQTDGQGETSIPPFNFVAASGHNRSFQQTLEVFIAWNVKMHSLNIYMGIIIEWLILKKKIKQIKSFIDGALKPLFTMQHI